jgi:hypothetical protein
MEVIGLRASSKHVEFKIPNKMALRRSAKRFELTISLLFTRDRDPHRDAGPR